MKLANAEKLFLKLVEKYDMPFVTARNANDISPSDHRLFVGRPGTFAQRGANFVVQICDVYLAIGTRLSLSQTGYNFKDYARSAKKIMVDISDAELNKKTVNINVKVKADAKKFIQALTDKLSKCLYDKNKIKMIRHCFELKKKYPVVLNEYAKQRKYVNSYYFISILSDLLSKDDIIVTDMGFAYQNTHQALAVKKGQIFFTNGGLIPQWDGDYPLQLVLLAQDKKNARTICVAGEGGLMMTIQELATIKHHNLPIKLFIFNNGGYLTIKQTQEHGFEGRMVASNKESGISFPEFRHIAKGFGINYSCIKSHSGMRANVSKILEDKDPAICELILDHDQIQGPKAINRRDKNGNLQQHHLRIAIHFSRKKSLNLI